MENLYTKMNSILIFRIFMSLFKDYGFFGKITFEKLENLFDNEEIESRMVMMDRD